jgi:histidinol dehydrogenase
MLRIHVEGKDGFAQALESIAQRGETDHARVEPVVREIIAAVRAEGDAAVKRFSQKHDGRVPEKLFVREYDGAGALAKLAPADREALELAAVRIEAYHEHQRDAGFVYEEGGVTLGLRVRPVRRAGVYAPGGKARYPSSVLMSAIPAKVAGVADILLATPAPNDALLAAAHLSGVKGILDAGGAQAIAALAYGTESVPRVDVLVGPGNAYVACAKRLVYGTVQIDGIAGPSEILVVADESADAVLVAADLLSQAEHDEDAYPLLVCSSAGFAEAVNAEIVSQLSTLPRQAIAGEAVRRNGHAFVIAGRERLAEVADRMAPEHLALHVADPAELLERIQCVGAAFLGHLTPEAAGDYLAGPSHVLPTGGSVRFGSPLGVYSFHARTSILGYSAAALRSQAGAIGALARLEGLEGHARAVEKRLTKLGT